MQDVEFIQCGREITAAEIEKIRSTVTDLGRLSRSSIIEAVCEELQWFAATGAYKIEACTKLLGKLEAQGFLELPDKRKPGGVPRQNLKDTLPQVNKAQGLEVVGKLGDIGPINLTMVENDRDVSSWNALVARYHYLGYSKPIGCFMRYFVCAPEVGILGCVLFAGAARSLTFRDAWIGWTSRQRLRNLAWVINNVRFLILPSVRVIHLASHVLGQLERRVALDWEQRWGYRPVLMESFVIPVRFVAHAIGLPIGNI